MDGQARHRRNDRSRGSRPDTAEGERGAIAFQEVAGRRTHEWEDSRRSARVTCPRGDELREVEPNERAPKLAELLKRIDTSHDWTQKEVVALLDDVTAIYPSLPGWAESEARFTLGGAVQTGQRLPADLENAPWGEAQSNGLRVAWLLGPRAEQHRLGTPLKSRILFHNAGNGTVVFRALTWNQSRDDKARDAKGADINITSTYS